MSVAPLSIVPPGAAFVLDVNVARLRENARGAELSRLGLARLLLTRAGDAFQPLHALDELVVVVPGIVRLAGERNTAFQSDAVAVIGSGRFEAGDVADAALATIRTRGGEPLRTNVGSFVSVRDLRGTGEVAARDGLFVLSDGAYLRALLAAADGQKSEGTELERARDAVHAELRRTFGRGAPATATLTLPPGSLEAALDDPSARDSPLAAVRSAALRAHVGESLDLRALLVCGTRSDCTRVVRFLNDARADVERALGPEALKGFTTQLGKDEAIVEISASVPLTAVTEFLASPAASR